MRKRTIYALVFLHLLSPLALGTVKLDGKTLASQRSSSVLGRLKTQSTQRGIPANRAAHGVHRQRASEKPRGVCICFWCRLRWVLQRSLGDGGQNRVCDG